jgi:hypothetical protein
MISIDFQITKDNLTFKDAIVLEDNHGLSDMEIETMKQKRFDDWYAIVTAPSEEPVATPSEEE